MDPRRARLVLLCRAFAAVAALIAGARLYVAGAGPLLSTLLGAAVFAATVSLGAWLVRRLPGPPPFEPSPPSEREVARRSARRRRARRRVLTDPDSPEDPR